VSQSPHFASLDETLRCAYLEAMDVPLWIPRDTPEIEVISPSAETKTDASEAHESSALAQALNPNHNTEVVKTEKTTNKKQPISQPEQQRVQTQSSSSTQYLKLVSHSSASDADKQILVICRHSKDQIAQTFVANRRPSRFMQDYTQAITDLLKRKSDGITINIQLAQSVETALSDDCEPIEQVFQALKPDLILLLGDESLRYLLGLNNQLAEVRGKLHHLQSTPAVVSYHPDALIKNPQLKKLAQEDLSFIVNLLLKDEN
jgi:hypothetical protein